MPSGSDPAEGKGQTWPAPVAAGRYRDVGEVLAAGVGLLRRQDAARAELLASVVAAEQEGDRLGYLSLEAVEREMDEVITRAARRSA